jgi:hypothetical protein
MIDNNTKYATWVDEIFCLQIPLQSDQEFENMVCYIDFILAISLYFTIVSDY